MRDMIRVHTTCLGWVDGELDCSHSIRRTPRRVCDRPDQLGSTLLGISTGCGAVCRSCACNIYNALVRRHLVPRNTPTQSFTHAYGWLDAVYALVVGAYAEHLRSFDLWLGKWPKSKQQQITQSVLFDPVVPWLVKCFAKREVYIGIPDKARLIQAYFNLATQEAWARECYALQKAYCSVDLDYSGVEIKFACGMNADDIAEWMQDVLKLNSRVWWYERDFKSFDASVGDAAFDLKLHAYRCSPGLQRFCAASRDVTGSCYTKFGKFKFSEHCGTKSGHCDTTLGNSIINAACIVEAFVANGLQGGALVMGDDVVAYVTTDFCLDSFIGVEAAFGFVPKARKFTEWRDVSFISGCWMRVNQHQIGFMPKLGRLLSKLAFTVNPPGKKKIGDYCFSVASGLRSTCGGIPIFRALLSKFTRKGKLMQVKRFAEFFGSRGFDLSVCVREVCLRYSISENELFAFEKLLYSLPQVCVFRHPIVDIIDSVDNFDLADRVLVGMPMVPLHKI